MNDVDVARAAAAAGAAVVREWFGKGAATDFKGAVDPVTEADRRAEAAILELLADERPGDAVLSEEGGGGGDAERRWLIDPLDGTVNFVHGLPHVAVSVALYEGEQPKVGVVLDVLREEAYVAQAGEGTTLNGRAISVSAIDEPQRAIIGTGFPYDRHEHPGAYAATVAAVLERFQGIRRHGAAALDLAWMAVGRIDGFWEYQLGPWDVAAGILLIREAGGVVTDQDGNPARPGDRVIVAGNAQIHPTLLATVSGSLPAHLR